MPCYFKLIVLYLPPPTLPTEQEVWLVDIVQLLGVVIRRLYT